MAIQLRVILVINNYFWRNKYMTQMTPKTTNAVTFPKGSFGKKWDEIVVTGEIYRASTHQSHLKEKDKKFNVSVKISQEDFKALKTWGGAFDGLPMSGLKKVMLKKKVLDEKGEPTKNGAGDFIFELDDEGEPVREFSHYQVTFSQNKIIKGEPSVVKVAAKKGIDYKPEDFIAEGSKVAVKGSIWDWTHEGKKGFSVNLSQLAILDLVKLEGAGGDEWGGMGIDMSDFEVSAADNPFGSEEKEDVPQEQPAQQQETPDLPEEDGFEDVPF